MQRCKYLDDLGFELEKYGTNFTKKDDRRIDKWEEQRKQYGFDERETWNLDRIFIEWIYTRFMMYKEVCSIDLDYHNICYKGKNLTQEEAIDEVLSLSKKILQSEYPIWDKNMSEMVLKNTGEICEILKELLPYMWW